MVRVGSCNIERLDVGEHERLRALRLRALRDAPQAFGTRFADAVAWPSSTWQQQLEQMTTFVAVLSPADVRTDVGMVRCVLHPEAQTASLVSLWVAPEVRRDGIAARLVDAVVTYARRKEMGRIVLDVVETNAPAIALYRKHGFVPNGERVVFPESCQGMAEQQFELLL